MQYIFGQCATKMFLPCDVKMKNFLLLLRFIFNYMLQNMVNVKYADTSFFIIMYQILENQILISKNSMN